ncbi:MAG: GNAT family N-acetyltransferase [Candidatus Fimadaptatus sp.]
MLRLILPDHRCCAFRQALMADPATMAYNAPWFPPEGTIPFPEEEWDAFLAGCRDREPEAFLGFLENEEGLLVGEVNWHDMGRSMGIVIKAEYRGRGYGGEGLAMLKERAFAHPEIPCLENNFESERDRALAMHLHAGFVPAGRDQDGYLVLRCMNPNSAQG